MKSRRIAREAVLQALYQCDTLEDWSPEIVSQFFERFYPDENLGVPDALSEAGPLGYSRSLVQFACDNLQDIDSLIAKVSTNWPLSRMTRVDRNLLRFATAELMASRDIPYRVVLNEAIEIAKRFGGDDSPVFINGVLDKVVPLSRIGTSSMQSTG